MSSPKLRIDQCTSNDSKLLMYILKRNGPNTVLVVHRSWFLSQRWWVSNRKWAFPFPPYERSFIIIFVTYVIECLWEVDKKTDRWNFGSYSMFSELSLSNLTIRKKFIVFIKNFHYSVLYSFFLGFLLYLILVENLLLLWPFLKKGFMGFMAWIIR